MAAPPMEAIAPGTMKPAWQEAVRTWELMAEAFPGEFLSASEAVAWVQRSPSHTQVLVERNRHLREVRPFESRAQKLMKVKRFLLLLRAFVKGMLLHFPLFCCKS